MALDLRIFFHRYPAAKTSLVSLHPHRLLQILRCSLQGHEMLFLFLNYFLFVFVSPYVGSKRWQSSLSKNPVNTPLLKNNSICSSGRFRILGAVQCPAWPTATIHSTASLPENSRCTCWPHRYVPGTLKYL